MTDILDHIGNLEILKYSKTAFLCSRKVPASVVLKCYDWAIEQREAGNCIISGFHSQIERDVYHYLAKGKQPIIIAMARGIPKKLPLELKKKADNGNLLIITPFDKNVTKVTIETAAVRNRFMMELADKIIVGYVNPYGRLIQSLKGVNKKCDYLLT